MPKIEGAPKELNTLLEKVYADTLKEYKDDKAKASAAAWSAAKKAGWKKVKGKWEKKESASTSEHSVPAMEHEIFQTGTHVTKSGETITYSERDLDEMCETYNADEPPHYIPGHSSDWPGITMIPSLGRIGGGLKRVGNKLMAVGAEFTDRLAGWVQEGFYNQRSAEIGRGEDGKLHLYAVAMLGAQPPAVKGMPPINASMLTSDFMFSRPSNVVVEFAEPVDSTVSMTDHLNVVEQSAKEDTLKNLEECCGRFIENVGSMLDEEYDEDRLRQEVYELTNDILTECNLHSMFLEKLEQLEESDEGEYSKHKGFWKEFAKTLKSAIFPSTNSQESIVDTQKEAALNQTIADQKKKLDEFAAAKTEADRIKAEAADAKLRTDIKAFCIANKLDTKKYQELQLEQILFAAAKASQTVEFSSKDASGKDIKEQKPLLEVLQNTLKQFQVATPTEGELQQFSETLPGEQPSGNAKITAAEKYVADHPAEFSEYQKPVQKIAAALRMESNKQIHFTN